jgi:starch-binding outer membrane protein, SusD/RagB family
MKIKIISIVTIAALMSVTSCTDLGVEPKSLAIANNVFTDPEAYKQFLARIYAGLAISGQQGPAGNPDIKGIDEGFSNYLRQYWKAQELSTDEAVIGWNDGTLPTYHLHTWTPQNEFINALFNRIYFQISMVNEFMRETTDAKLDSRNANDAIKEQVKVFRAEARVMRALSYMHGLDLFGAVPFVTENDVVGTKAPQQTTKQHIFEYIESELLEAEPDLIDARANEYGRADKAMAWMILAKLYLNAKVYVDQDRYTDCVTYTKKIINAGYELQPKYANLFNLNNEFSSEVIFSVNFDGLYTQTYGGMTFLVHAAIGGKMVDIDYGVKNAWSGLRTTKNLVTLFPDVTGDEDSRAIFFTTDQSLEIPETPTTSFQQGFAVPKFTNTDEDGEPGSHPEFVDTDFPFYRVADAYLMYAEAVIRGGDGGSEAEAVSLINSLRQRAYGDASGNIDASDLTLDFIIDERARELYWEGHRRTDLIRFGLFTDSESDNPRAIWPWKGGVAAGVETETFRNVYPFPAAQIIANPTLKQNDDY